jgi:transcriptional regulator with XRE-family HTH domain
VTESRGLLERARKLAGLSRSELARRSGASRPTLAAYSAGTKSPNFATAERIVHAAGFDLANARDGLAWQLPGQLRPIAAGSGP